VVGAVWRVGGSPVVGPIVYFLHGGVSPNRGTPNAIKIEDTHLDVCPGPRYARQGVPQPNAFMTRKDLTLHCSNCARADGGDRWDRTRYEHEGFVNGEYLNLEREGYKLQKVIAQTQERARNVVVCIRGTRHPITRV